MQILILKIPFEKVSGQVYYEPFWQYIFGLTHSLWLWPLCLLIAIIKRKVWLQYFFSSMLLHIGLDFFVHADDAYAHFTPFSMWKFHSPISYYDLHHFGRIISLVEIILLLISSIVAYKKLHNKYSKIGLLVFAVIYTSLFAFFWISGGFKLD